MATLQQVLGAKNLVGVIQSVKSGLPDDIIPPAFLTVTRTVEGAICTYRKVEGDRRVARLVQYGAPSKARELKGVSEVPVKLMHSLESIHFNPSVLTNLTNIDNEQKQKLAQAEIARETKEFKTLFTNARIACAFSALANGKIYFNANGEILPTSTGALTTIDFQVPGTNKDQLGGLIDASWATAGTKIHQQLKAIKRQARKLTGYPITEAFYGKNVLDYILSNTTLQTYMKHNPQFTDALLKYELPPGFLGLNWHPVDEMFYETNVAAGDVDKITAGATAEAFGADSVTFTPAPSPEWWEVVEGSYPVPTSIDSAESAEALAGNIMEVNGMFAYAYLTRDPVTIKEVAGDTHLTLIKVPKAVFLSKVANF
jgi:hypothetical protein